MAAETVENSGVLLRATLLIILGGAMYMIRNGLLPKMYDLYDVSSFNLIDNLDFWVSMQMVMITVALMMGVLLILNLFLNNGKKPGFFIANRELLDSVIVLWSGGLVILTGYVTFVTL